MQRIQHISIPKPCHQTWQNMIPNGEGRHCQSCAKTVIDFTVMSDQQLMDYLSANNQVCGRFASAQLSSINHRLYIEKLNGHGYWKRLLMSAALLAIIPFTRGTAQVKAGQYQTENKPRDKARENAREQSPPVDTTVIKGCIKDEHGVVLPGVMVRIKGTNTSTSSDAEGNFKLRTFAGTQPIMVFSFVGFQTQECRIKTGKDCQIVMHEMVGMLGEVVIVRSPFYKRWFHRYISRPLRKVWAKDASI